MAGRTVFLLSSPQVLRSQPTVVELLQPLAARWVVLEVPDGESAKQLEQAERLWHEMLEVGKRDSRMVCLGGGSVGDLGGYVAGCFLRGIEFVQLPTTLLAQVDASIGGKTGVDLPAGKNTVGLFHHPAYVVADTGWLGSLDQAELRAGLAEVIKMAFVLDPSLLTQVEEQLESLLAGDPEKLAPVVAGAVAAKCGVVQSDPAEGDRRRLLNFGHTLAHAIEAACDYRGMRHGDAVSWGMLFALRLAERRGLAAADAGRLRTLIGRLGLPPLPKLDPPRLVELMGRDKKATEAGLAWVLPVRVGAGRMVADVPAAEVEAELRAFLG
nr:3-dehydroquinate synthase-like [Nerophis lumbriciformis]